MEKETNPGNSARDFLFLEKPPYAFHSSPPADINPYFSIYFPWAFSFLQQPETRGAGPGRTFMAFGF